MPRTRSERLGGLVRATLTLAALWALRISAADAASPPDSAQAPAAAPDSARAPTAPPPPLRVGRAAEWDTLETGLPEEVRLRPIYGLRYNRVEGLALTLGGAYRTARGTAPVLYAAGTGATSRAHAAIYATGFEIPFGDRPWLRIGASAYRRTATEDEWIVGEIENTLFALFARTDYRDYYDAKGGLGHLAWSPGTDFSLRAGARFESQRSLAKEVKFSVTGRHSVFRPNPAIRDGDEQVFTLECRVGPRELPLKGGTHGELRYERSGSPLKGDFDYGRLRGVVRTRIRLSPGQDFRVRLIAGSTRSGALPAQKVWHLGGIGTLRGRDYKATAGDQFFLVNAEHYRRVRKNLYAFTFLDYGAAWFGSGNLDRQRPALDGGLGFRIGEGPAALTLAKNLRDKGSKLRVGVRLGGSF